MRIGLIFARFFPKTSTDQLQSAVLSFGGAEFAMPNRFCEFCWLMGVQISLSNLWRRGRSKQGYAIAQRPRYFIAFATVIDGWRSF